VEKEGGTLDGMDKFVTRKKREKERAAPVVIRFGKKPAMKVEEPVEQDVVEEIEEVADDGDEIEDERDEFLDSHWEENAEKRAVYREKKQKIEAMPKTIDGFFGKK
jgi:hypothetical protein